METMSLSPVRVVVDITTKRAKLNIRTHRPKMKATRIPAKMTVRTEMPTFRVNWDKVRAQIGLTPMLELNRQLAQEAVQDAQEAITEIVRDGDSMMQIAGNANPIPAIAQSKLLKAQPEINIGLMPQSPLELEWDTGFFEAEWTEGDLQIEWEINPNPEYSVEPYEVEIRLKDLPPVKIKENVATVKGKNVDKKI